jgi:hypothetical protein
MWYTGPIVRLFFKLGGEVVSHAATWYLEYMPLESRKLGEIITKNALRVHEDCRRLGDSEMHAT